MLMNIQNKWRLLVNVFSHGLIQWDQFSKLALRLYQRSYRQLNRRERLLAGLILSLSIIFFFDQMVVSPLLFQHKKINQDLLVTNEKIKALQLQLIALNGKTNNHSEARSLSHKEQYQQMQHDLVLAKSVLAVTMEEALLSGSMQQLMMKILNDPQDISIVEIKNTATKRLFASTQTSPNRKIFQHGMKLRIRGEYTPLTNFLLQLETLPQRIFLDKVQLQTINYPLFEASINLFILSTSAYWLKY